MAGRAAAARSGVYEVALEDEPSWGTFPPTATALGLLGVAGRGARAGDAGAPPARAAGGRSRRRHRRRGPERARGSCGGCCAAGARNGRTCVARGRGDRAEPPESETLVVLAHHDAPQTGLLFDQTLQRRAPRAAPRSCIERAKTPLPQWWIGLAGPLCTIAAARRPAAAPAARAGLAHRRARRGARGRRVAQRDRAGRQRQPLRRGRARRARRDARASARAGPARAARLLRRRGDAAGRHPRVHRASPRRARARAHARS